MRRDPLWFVKREEIETILFLEMLFLYLFPCGDNTFCCVSI